MKNLSEEDIKIITVYRFLSYSQKSISRTFYHISKHYYNLMHDKRPYGDLEDILMFSEVSQDMVDAMTHLLVDDMDSFFDSLDLEKIIKTFSDTEQKIIFLKYYLDLTDEAIGKILGLSRVSICNIKNTLLKKLKLLLNDTKNQDLFRGWQ